MGQQKKLPALTAFRFVAAFYVFVFHFNGRATIPTNQWTGNLLANGAVGMTFFFVLSGFVITYAACVNGFDRPTYLKGRFLRIYPAYAAAVAASFLVFDYGLTGWAAVGNVVANVLSVQGWFYQLFEHGINGGTWSLSVEWFFYVTFAFFFPLLTRLTTRGIIVTFAVAWIATCIPLLITDASLGLPGYTMYSNPLARFPEFIIGSTLAILFVRGVRVPYPLLTTAVATAIIVAYLATVFEPWIYMRQNWLVSPLIGLILLAIAPMRGPVLSHPVVQWLGEVSYSFFLLQFIPLYALGKAPWLAQWSLPGTFVLVFSATLGLAALSYKYVEIPFLPRKPARPPAVQAGAA